MGCPVDAAYRRLITTDLDDPSDVLNEVYLARRVAEELGDAEMADLVERKCVSLELEVHLRFTPLTLVSLCHA